MDTDICTPLSEEETESLIDSIAKKIIGRRLESIAVLLLEMNKPLSFIASQSLLVAMPMLGPLLGADKISDFSKLLSKRENIDRLISRIEELAVDTKISDSSAA